MCAHTHAHMHTHTHTHNQTHPWVFCRGPDCNEVVYWRVVTISSHLHNCQAIIDKLAIIIGWECIAVILIPIIVWGLHTQSVKWTRMITILRTAHIFHDTINAFPASTTSFNIHGEVFPICKERCQRRSCSNLDCSCMLRRSYVLKNKNNVSGRFNGNLSSVLFLEETASAAQILWQRKG